MKKAFVKHHSDIELIIVNTLMTLEFFCNVKHVHDNGIQYINVSFTGIWGVLKTIEEHQTMQSAFAGLLRVVCIAQPRE